MKVIAFFILFTFVFSSCNEKDCSDKACFTPPEFFRFQFYYKSYIFLNEFQDRLFYGTDMTLKNVQSLNKTLLKAVQTRGCSWMALPSIKMGSKAWMPRRWRVGARLSITGYSLTTSSRVSHTSGVSRSTIFLALLTVETNPFCSSL